MNRSPGLDRRTFLRGLAAAPAAWSLGQLGAWCPHGEDRSLIVLELQGGNDGLATVIPTDSKAYGKLRPTLGSVRNGARALGDGTALHAALANWHRHVIEGRATVVHGVGYAQPDRSHFRSRDIWQVGDPQLQRVGASTTGWLGRAADLLAGQGAGVPAAALGQLEVPLALHGQRGVAPSLRSIEDFQWSSPSGPVLVGSALRALVADGAAVGDLRAFVQRTQVQAVELADDLRAALARYQPQAEYPDSPLGRDLQLAARLVISGFGTRLLHVGLGGFDTHARQLPTHAALLGQLDAALDAFVRDLEGHRRTATTALLLHSEFGRRAAENASQGTDHGAAAPVFVAMGGSVGGTLGSAPDLEDLLDGDVRCTIDFRSVYAELLQWLGLDAAVVLGGQLPRLGLWPAPPTQR